MRDGDDSVHVQEILDKARDALAEEGKKKEGDDDDSDGIAGTTGGTTTGYGNTAVSGGWSSSDAPVEGLGET